MLLTIYLNDHLAGATAARELARRAASNNRSSWCGGPLERLAGEIEEDRETLLSIMRSLDVGVDRLKVAGGWSMEKLGRLKLNGRLMSYSPLSRVVELEALAVGVRGKRALWTALDQVVGDRPELASVTFGDLVARADAQLDELEVHRLRAANEAFH